jgi:hypothetical protein
MKSISRKAPGSMRMIPRLDSRSRSRLKDQRPYLLTVPPLLERVSCPIISLSRKRAAAEFATALFAFAENRKDARMTQPFVAHAIRSVVHLH